MTHSGFFDEAGQPITLEEWGRRFEQPRTLLRDEVGEFVVATMWHGFVDPMVGASLFGTALFRGSAFVVELDRYDTEQQARGGHAGCVARLRERMR